MSPWDKHKGVESCNCCTHQVMPTYGCSAQSERSSWTSFAVRIELNLQSRSGKTFLQ